MNVTRLFIPSLILTCQVAGQLREYRARAGEKKHGRYPALMDAPADSNSHHFTVDGSLMGKAKKRKLLKPTSRPYIKPSNSSTRLPTSTKKVKATPQRPTIPFETTSRILLLGDGDFSFARSLIEHHSCISLYATSFDTRSGILSKYPQAAANAKVIEAEDGSKVEYGVDATKLGRAGGGGKEIRKGGWNNIVFNFPHVGGLTKDVNRQVRANQGAVSPLTGYQLHKS